MSKNKKEWKYKRRLQLKHFYDDDAGKTRRTWMEVQYNPPTKSQEGWVNDGKVRLSLGENRDVKGAFLLSIEEVCRLFNSLEMIAAEHEKAKAKLWDE
ncbi:MAG: hypothetical protein ACOC38_09900 [Promethearchaeia archaeon]